MNTGTGTASAGQKNRVARLENFTTSKRERYVFCRYTAPNGVSHIIPLLLSGDRALVFPNIGELKKTLIGELFAVAGFVDKFVFSFLESTNDEAGYDSAAEFERAAAILADLLDGINLSDEDSDVSLMALETGEIAGRFAFIEQTDGTLASRSMYFGIYTDPQGVEYAVAFYTHGNSYVDIYASLEDFYAWYFGETCEAGFDSVSWDFFENRESLDGVPYETERGETVPSNEPHFERWLVAKLDAEITGGKRLTLNRREEKALC